MPISRSHRSFFTRQLMAWSATHHRHMPWKGEKDPYKVWLSEVILQQTRVSQGMPYYLKFIEAYPNVQALANAPEDEVMRLWQGLGYYTRARNLHHSAKVVAHQLHGKFPATYDDILQLKGVGPYSAAAIASFAFDEPRAVVDGNVMRVLSRYFGIEDPVDTTAGKGKISEVADVVIDKQNPGGYNQAIMDFGAAVCLPHNPLCSHCPLQAKCTAFQQRSQATLPVRSKRITKKDRYFTYLVLQHGASFFVHKRQGNDIWKGLFEFPLIECNKLLFPSDLEAHPAWQTLTDGLEPEVAGISKTYTHVLTHQRLKALFVRVNVKNDMRMPFIPVAHKKLDKFAFPRLIVNYLKDNFIYLNSGK